jgi:hypothetical protein
MYVGIQKSIGAKIRVGHLSQLDLPQMPLNDVAVLNAKPKLKSFHLFDERGLFLEVSPSGGKW